MPGQFLDIFHSNNKEQKNCNTYWVAFFVHIQVMNCSEKCKQRKVKISLNKSIFFCSNISQTSSDKNNFSKLQRIFAQTKFTPVLAATAKSTSSRHRQGHYGGKLHSDGSQK